MIPCEIIPEFEIDARTENDIKALLQATFELFPNDRIYYTQVPNFRILHRQGGAVVGHLGVVFRMMALDTKPFRAFGIMDFCVKKSYRNSGIGTALITQSLDLATRYAIDFVLLFGEIDAFYQRHGFELATNNCRWVLMKEHQTLGIVHRKIPNTLLVKQIGAQRWDNEATLDLLGTVF